MSKKQSYGWIFLADIWNKSILVRTNEADFIDFLMSNGLSIVDSEDKADTLLWDVESSNSNINFAFFQEIICISSRRKLPVISKFIFNILTKKFGFDMDSYSESRKRVYSSFFRKKFKQFRLEERLMLFLNEDLCTHIIRDGDVAGINQFYKDISGIKKLSFLRKMPFFLKKFVFKIFSEREVLVFRK